MPYATKLRFAYAWPYVAMQHLCKALLRNALLRHCFAKPGVAAARQNIAPPLPCGSLPYFASALLYIALPARSFAWPCLALPGLASAVGCITLPCLSNAERRISYAVPRFTLPERSLARPYAAIAYYSLVNSNRPMPDDRH